MGSVSIINFICRRGIVVQATRSGRLSLIKEGRESEFLRMKWVEGMVWGRKFEGDFLRGVDSNPKERAQQQNTCHQKLRRIETVSEVYNSSEEDGHDKGAGLTEEIHYAGERTGT